MDVEFILYVEDQERSAAFYQELFIKEPVLNVPGMTEFLLSEKIKLGIMPNNGIHKILKHKTPHPKLGNGIPRCELYLRVTNPKVYLDRGLSIGGKLVCDLKQRNWGEEVGYITDPDGHILAFAKSK